MKAAQELGLTSGAISQFVTGTARPKDTVLRLFRMLLGDATLYSEEHHPPSKTDRDLLPLEGGEMELVRELRKLDGNSRRKVLSSLKLLLTAIPASSKSASAKPASSKSGRRNA
jgi:hypothetical protein